MVVQVAGGCAGRPVGACAPQPAGAGGRATSAAARRAAATFHAVIARVDSKPWPGRFSQGCAVCDAVLLKPSKVCGLWIWGYGDIGIALGRTTLQRMLDHIDNKGFVVVLFTPQE